MYKSEKQFANALTLQGKTWKAQPRRFRLGKTTYTPDFYCPEEDIYYEVKKQLDSKDLKKILKFKKAYPAIVLKIVSPAGYPYYSLRSWLYVSMLEKILSIMKAKDITEISTTERQFLRKYAPCIRGIRRPLFNGRRPASKVKDRSVVEAGIKEIEARIAALEVVVEGRGKQK